MKTKITGVVLKLWSGGTGGLTGQTVFWLDNVKLIASPNAVLPPPIMKIQTAKPGLQLSASAPGQQYQRQNIRTLTADADGNPISYSWVGNSMPVTYSMTIKEFPDAAHRGFQAHIFLVPESSMPNGAGDASIDWNAGEVVFIQIGNNADGTASAAFRYKINQPGGNSMLWNSDPAAGPVGALANVSDASALGTWSVTFKNNTDGTITAPSGASANFSMPASAAAMFANPVVAYFGIQPNQPGNIGQSAVLSRVQISGVAAPLMDDFSGATLDAVKLQVVAQMRPLTCRVNDACLRTSFLSAFFVFFGHPTAGLRVMQVQADERVRPTFSEMHVGQKVQAASQPGLCSGRWGCAAAQPLLACHHSHFILSRSGH